MQPDAGGRINRRLVSGMGNPETSNPASCFVILYMPAKSKKQQQAAGAALSASRGERGVSSLKGASKSMYESMDEKELKKMASTKRKGKPERVGK
jgi:Protein of unknwon function (DUF3008)